MLQIKDLADKINQMGRISAKRLIYESDLMMREFRHVGLEINDKFGPIWKGYVKSGKIKNYFMIEYPYEYPSWRPHLYPLTNELGEFKLDPKKIGLHPLRGRGICLFTHDGGPNSWNDSLTAVDCVKKYISILNSQRSGILDHQDLQDRLTIPGIRKNEIKYMMTKNGYENLRSLKRGILSGTLIRSSPELYILYDVSHNNQEIVLDQSWFSDHSFWPCENKKITGSFIEISFKIIKPEWSKKFLLTFLNKEQGLEIEGEFLLLIPEEHDVQPVIITLNPLNNYYLSLFDQKNLFHRVDGIISEERKQISTKSILFVALGSIGSKIALNLARTGISNFILYDMDFFNIENVVRHTGDITHLFMPKVEIISSQIQKINPDSKIKQYAINPFSEGEITDFRSNLIGSDLIICSTGSYESEFLLNRELINHNKSAIFVSALGEASYGEIYRVIPKKTACFSCINLNTYENPKIYPIIEKDTRNDIPRREGYKEGGIPGIDIDISIIANLASRMVLQTLFELNNIKSTIYPPCTSNHMYWSNHKGWIFNDSSLEIVNINHPRNSKCEQCSTGNILEPSQELDEEAEKILEKAMEKSRFKGFYN